MAAEIYLSDNMAYIIPSDRYQTNIRTFGNKLITVNENMGGIPSLRDLTLFPDGQNDISQKIDQIIGISAWVTGEGFGLANRSPAFLPIWLFESSKAGLMVVFIIFFLRVPSLISYFESCF